jgi:protein-S-isoprenylcysteine O-methyltransferase Ste14
MGRLWKIDGVLWLLGVLLAAVGVVDGLRSGRSVMQMLRSTWFYSSGLLLVLGGVLLLVIVLRWRASREEADLLRKYPPQPR